MQSHTPKETLQMSQGPGLAEVLHALDDETLQRIFKMAQPFMVNNLRRDEDGAAVGQSPLMKEGDLRCYKGGTADMPLQVTDQTVKDLSII